MGGDDADIAEAKLKESYGIVEGSEEESEDCVDLFYYVNVKGV